MSSEEDDGLTAKQFRWLVLVAAGIGALVLLSILGITAASVVFGGDSGGAPNAAFDVQTIDRGGDLAANVTHAGGDGVNPSALYVEVNGERRGTWEELGGEGYGVVAPGHELVLANVTAGDSVTVAWIGDDERVQLGDGTIQPAGGTSS